MEQNRTAQYPVSVVHTLTRRLRRALGIRWATMPSPRMLVRHHPAYYDTTTTVRSHFRPTGLQDWYDSVLLSASTLGEYAASTKTVEKVSQILLQLQPDDYVRYLLSY